MLGTAFFYSFNFLGALPTNGMRSMWEFVFVAQFLRVFQGKFGFVNFTAEVCIKIDFKITRFYAARLFVVFPLGKKLHV